MSAVRNLLGREVTAGQVLPPLHCTVTATTIVLGALAGAQTMTAALAAVQERSESPVAVIGYSSTVGVGHILISIGGTAVIWMVH